MHLLRCVSFYQAELDVKIVRIKQSTGKIHQVLNSDSIRGRTKSGILRGRAFNNNWIFHFWNIIRHYGRECNLALLNQFQRGQLGVTRSLAFHNDQRCEDGVPQQSSWSDCISKRHYLESRSHSSDRLRRCCPLPGSKFRLPDLRYQKQSLVRWLSPRLLSKESMWIRKPHNGGRVREQTI